jgi:iron complex outermembrane receptor protein
MRRLSVLFQIIALAVASAAFAADTQPVDVKSDLTVSAPATQATAPSAAAVAAQPVSAETASVPAPISKPVEAAKPVAPAAQSTSAAPAKKDPTVTVEEMVVTAPRISDPLTVVTDPKAPRQPVPATDGGEFLKAIPGFSVIRKGGIDGDPVLRGSSGSRVLVLLDNELLFGGCGGRMDPPTSYVFPELYDRLTVVKGPETVIHGSGNSAGVVMFDKFPPHFEPSDALFSGRGSMSGMAGSFGRSDSVTSVIGGNEKFYIQGIGTHSESNDYKDGDGNSVHSLYTRWSDNAALGWTPDKDTLVELSGIKSDGRAAYADRTMDGAQFVRENLTLKYEKKNVSTHIAKLEAQVYYNYANHIMDNYTLRTRATTTSTVAAMNVDRFVSGNRVAATVAMNEQTQLVTGFDTMRDSHRYRDSTMGLTDPATATDNFLHKAWIEDMHFNHAGVFAELTKYYTQDDKLIAGLREDYHEAYDNAFCRGYPDASGTGCAKVFFTMDDAHGRALYKTLPSGFVRYENIPNRWYAGIGHVERFPDYWEFEPGAAPDGTHSGFLYLKPEKTTQFDTGFSWNSGKWSGSLAGFYNRAVDYILITWSPNYISRNVRTESYGGEGDLGYAISDYWKTVATIAYVYGENLTDKKPLAQQPAPEGRLSLEYDNHVYSVGALWRHAERQERYDLNSGDIVMNGMDKGPTPGFNVYSINAGWRATKTAQLTAGVDNVFDATYSEHLSKTNVAPLGYVPTNALINEPGRFSWAKLIVNF